jgi:hypothetical protein
MELQRLDQYKARFKEFTDKIGSLQNYLLELNKQSKDPPIITPYVLSQQLHVPEGDALFLLSLAAKENILQRKFYVFSNEDNQLGEYPDAESIPDVITDYSGDNFDRDHYYVDLGFELDK